MAFLISFGRYALPLIGFVILLSCAVSLLSKNTRIGIVGYLVNTANGDRIPLKNYETSIGRSNSCDIVLAYTTVSRFHAVISKRAGKWIVFDTNSKTGTFVNNTRIVERRAVANGDSVMFGNAMFTFYERLPELGDILPDVKPSYQSINKTADDFKIHYSLISDSDGTEFPLDDCEACLFGRSEDAAIQLDSPIVSRKHALMSRTSKGFVIEDLNSAAGTLVNGRTISGVTSLKDGDIINICDYSFTFRTNDIRS